MLSIKHPMKVSTFRVNVVAVRRPGVPLITASRSQSDQERPTLIKTGGIRSSQGVPLFDQRSGLAAKVSSKAAQMQGRVLMFRWYGLLLYLDSLMLYLLSYEPRNN